MCHISEYIPLGHLNFIDPYIILLPFAFQRINPGALSKGSESFKSTRLRGHERFTSFDR